MIDPTEAKRIAVMLAAIGEPTRILILQHLVRGPAHVGQLAEEVGVPMVNMSHHLGVMRQAGLLSDTRQGRRIVYGLRPEVYETAGPEALGTLHLGSFRLVLTKPLADGKLKKKPAVRRR